MKIKTLHDPIKALYHDSAPDAGIILRITAGEEYVLLELQGGGAGLAGSAGQGIKALGSPPETWDLADPAHRQLLTAYYNALFNGRGNRGPGDGPEEFASAHGWKRCVMIGYFIPLYKRLHEAGIEVLAFDIDKDDPMVRPQEELLPELGRTLQVITTPLIFINRSWEEIFKAIGPKHEVLLIGPSVTYHEAYAEMPGVCGLFGSEVSKLDDELRSLVRNGGGMQSFKHKLVKTSF